MKKGCGYMVAQEDVFINSERGWPWQSWPFMISYSDYVQIGEIQEE